MNEAVSVFAGTHSNINGQLLIYFLIQSNFW
jgi:hypothetical protein